MPRIMHRIRTRRGQSHLTAYALLFTLAILFLLAIKTFLIHNVRWGAAGKNPRDAFRVIPEVNERPWEVSSEQEEMSEATRKNLLIAESPTFEKKARRKLTGNLKDPVVLKATTVLQETSAGRHSYALLKVKYIDVRAAAAVPEGSELSGWGGFWNSEDNAIYIEDDFLKDASAEFIAANMAHAVTHIDYGFNRSYWTEWTLNRHPEFSRDDFRISRDSIEEEYNALRSGILVWNEARIRNPKLADPCLDAWAALYEQGEAYTKALVRLQYPGAQVPEY